MNITGLKQTITTFMEEKKEGALGVVICFTHNQAVNLCMKAQTLIDEGLIEGAPYTVNITDRGLTFPDGARLRFTDQPKTLDEQFDMVFADDIITDAVMRYEQALAKLMPPSDADKPTPEAESTVEGDGEGAKGVTLASAAKRAPRKPRRRGGPAGPSGHSHVG